MICIREARDTDAAGIRDLFVAAYGDEYTYPDVYDEQRLKKLIFGEDVVLLVAEEEGGGCWGRRR